MSFFSLKLTCVLGKLINTCLLLAHTVDAGACAYCKISKILCTWILDTLKYRYKIDHTGPTYIAIDCGKNCQKPTFCMHMAMVSPWSRWHGILQTVTRPICHLSITANGTVLSWISHTIHLPLQPFTSSWLLLHHWNQHTGLPFTRGTIEILSPRPGLCIEQWFLINTHQELKCTW